MPKLLSTSQMRSIFIIISISYLLTACNGGGSSRDAATSSAELQLLGSKIFFDDNLSNPKGMSCSSCHSVGIGFSDPRSTAVSLGSDDKRLGTRNAQALSYAFFSPTFGFSAEEQDFIGGFFWDVAAFLRTLTDGHNP